MEIRLEQLLPANAPDYTHSKFTKNIIWIVAYEGWEWLGYGGFTEDGYLGPSFVKPFYRGKGIQRKLIAERIAFGKLLGLSTLTTAADSDNIWSIRNIEAAGFTETERKPHGKVFEIWYELKVSTNG